VFLKYGCYACHSDATTAAPEEIGPDLAGIADAKASSLDFGARHDLPRTLSAWLAAKVTQPRSFGSTLKMPAFTLTDDELADLVTALLSLSADFVPGPYRASPPASLKPSAPPPSGEVGRLFAKYRCLSCHIVGSQGQDLSTAPLTYQGSKTKPDWLTRYLRLPGTIYPLVKERMPVLGMTPDEARRLADYISDVYVDDTIPASVSPDLSSDAHAVQRGARLFQDKGCQSCHIVGNAGGYVGPALGEAGDRLRSGWIASWLENPQRWRREARCPDYGLTRDEILDLTAFLSTRRASAGSMLSAQGGPDRP
jgi:mono/diheme cytochrome c family protein